MIYMYDVWTKEQVNECIYICSGCMYVCSGYCHSFLLVGFVLLVVGLVPRPLSWCRSFMRGFDSLEVAWLRFLSRLPLHAGQLLSICVSFFSSAACMSPCSSRCSGQLFCLCIVCFLLRLACRCSAWLRARRDPPVRKAKKKYAQESKCSLLLSDCYLSVNRYSLCSAGVRGNTREDPEECCWRQSFFLGCRAQWQGLFALVRGVGGSHTPTNNI